MRGIPISTPLNGATKANATVNSRPCDLRNYAAQGDYKVLNDLLSITSRFTHGLVAEDHFSVTCNGEIYSYEYSENYVSEAHALLDLYISQIERPFRELNGEFVIIVSGHRSNEKIVLTGLINKAVIYFDKTDTGTFLAYQSQSELTEARNCDVGGFTPTNFGLISLEIFKIGRCSKTKRFNLGRTKDSIDNWCRMSQRAKVSSIYIDRAYAYIPKDLKFTELRRWA